MTHTIVITQRSDDYHACQDGRPEIWGNGRTQDEAIGDLIRSHPERFDIEVRFEPKK